MINTTIDSLREDIDLEPKTDVSAYLGIQICWDPIAQMVELTQPHLIENILHTTDMMDCHVKSTPTTLTPL